MRPIPWIIDSVERLLRRNPFELSKIFGYEQGGTVYSRADGLMSPAGMIGPALNGLKQPAGGSDGCAVYEFTGLPALRPPVEAAITTMPPIVTPAAAGGDT